MSNPTTLINNYNNFTHFTIKAERFIQKELTSSQNLLKNAVIARIAHLALIPCSHLTSVTDMVFGLGTGIAAIATLGGHKKVYVSAMNYLQGFNTVISLPFLNLLRTFNPSATIEQPDSFIKHDNNIFTFKIRNLVRDVARNCYHSESVLKNRVGARLAYAAYALTCVITRIADAIIGLIAATLALITVGSSQAINTHAYQGLQAPGLIKDLIYSMVKICHPQVGVEKILESNNS